MKTLNEIDRALKKAVEVIDQKKGRDIVVLDLTEIQGHFVDYFIIATCETADHMEAVAMEVEEKLKEIEVYPHHIEGVRGANWYLMDYGSFLIHLFTPRGREYYALETLWSAARSIKIGGEDENS